MIKLLDCTLRDGGYIVDFAFGDKTKAIVDKLILSGIDFIELGFLKDFKKPNQTTIFQNIKETQKYTKNYDIEKFFLMIKQGDFDIENLPDAKEKDINLRYIFKKKGIEKALSDCKKIISKGYKLFINPVFIQEYKKSEYIDLIKKLSELKPNGISIVDSMGSFGKKEIVELFKQINSFLNCDIAIGFHLHNNNECALINAKEIINIETKRQIILDCTLAGMGRGAGNICSELLAQILNVGYDIDLLENIVENELNVFWQKTPWGNSYPYYLASKHKVHSDYAKFLIEKGIEKDKDFETFFKKIPAQNRANFDLKLINSLLENTNCNNCSDY